MKKASRLFVPIICFILLSCEGDKIDKTRASREIQLNAEIEGIKTRASNSSWEAGDAIGLYMIKSGQTLSSSASALNVKYVTTGTTTFIPSNESDGITFPFDGSDVDFISYYPYREDIIDFTYLVDLSNQENQAALDLMYSNNAKSFNSKNPNVGLLFSHQLSKIGLNILHHESANLSNLKVIITNVGINASFDLAAGTLSATSDYGNISLRVNSDGSVAEGILLPEATLTDKELWFIIGDNEEVYKYPLADALEINSFDKSTKYNYNVTLFTDKIAAITLGSITDWAEGPSVNVTAGRTTETPPVIKGSKDSPFTIFEAQNYQGKTGVWVEGYIVGSFTGSSMGSFSSDTLNASASNLALADNRDETETDKIIPVQLPTGALRKALNLQENPDNLNKKVKIKGKLGQYFSAPGIREPKEYVLIDP